MILKHILKWSILSVSIVNFAYAEKPICYFNYYRFNAKLVYNSDCKRVPRMKRDLGIANFNGVCTANCNRGYSQPDGSSSFTISCTTETININEATPCLGNICNFNPDDAPNGHFMPIFESNEFNVKITYKCDEGFTPSSGEPAEFVFEFYCMKDSEGHTFFENSVICVEKKISPSTISGDREKINQDIPKSIECIFDYDDLHADLDYTDSNCHQHEYLDRRLGASWNTEYFSGVCRGKCKRGYSLPDGSSDFPNPFSCITSKIFNKNDATPCAENICYFNPDDALNGHFIPEIKSNQFSIKVQYQCDQGYILLSEEPTETVFDFYCEKGSDGHTFIDTDSGLICVKINECINGYQIKDGKCVAQPIPLWVCFFLVTEVCLASTLIILVFYTTSYSPRYTCSIFKSSTASEEMQVENAELSEI